MIEGALWSVEWALLVNERELLMISVCMGAVFVTIGVFVDSKKNPHNLGNCYLPHSDNSKFKKYNVHSNLVSRHLPLLVG